MPKNRVSNITVVVVFREYLESAIKCLSSAQQIATDWLAVDLGNFDNEEKLRSSLKGFEGVYLRQPPGRIYSEYVNEAIISAQAKSDFVLYLNPHEKIIGDTDKDLSQNLTEDYYCLGVLQGKTRFVEPRLFSKNHNVQFQGVSELHLPCLFKYVREDAFKNIHIQRAGLANLVDSSTTHHTAQSFIESAATKDPMNPYWQLKLAYQHIQSGQPNLAQSNLDAMTRVSDDSSWFCSFLKARIKAIDPEASKQDKLDKFLGASYVGYDRLEPYYYSMSFMYRIGEHLNAYNLGSDVLEELTEVNTSFYSEPFIAQYGFNQLMGRLCLRLNKHEEALSFFKKVYSDSSTPLKVKQEIKQELPSEWYKKLKQSLDTSSSGRELESTQFLQPEATTDNIGYCVIVINNDYNASLVTLFSIQNFIQRGGNFNFALQIIDCTQVQDTQSCELIRHALKQFPNSHYINKNMLHNVPRNEVAMKHSLSEVCLFLHPGVIIDDSFSETLNNIDTRAENNTFNCWTQTTNGLVQLIALLGNTTKWPKLDGRWVGESNYMDYVKTFESELFELKMHKMNADHTLVHPIEQKSQIHGFNNSILTNTSDGFCDESLHKIDAIYVINLDGSHERWQDIRTQFSKFPVLASRLRRFPAIRAQGQMGCSLSHRAIVEHAKQYGMRNVLVFEDDVKLNSDFCTRLNSALSQMDSTDKVWTMLYLGGFHLGFLAEQMPSLEDKQNPVRKLIQCFGTHAVLYNERSYETVLEIPVDKNQWAAWLEEYEAIDRYYDAVMFNRYIVNPIIATQIWTNYNLDS